MANVSFLRGPQANLPKTGIQEGAFYLTNDTNRLYFGQDSTHLTLLNQTVNIINSLAELEEIAGGWNDSQKADHVNDFYYISGANILAVYAQKDGVYKWVQINPDTDTTLSSVDISVDGSTAGSAKVSVGASDSKANAIEAGNFTITGDGTVHVTVDGAVIKIKGETYTLSGSVAANSATLKLASDVDATGSSVKFVGGAKTTISAGEDGAIKIDSHDSVIDTTEVEITADGKIKVTVNDDSGNTAEGTSATAISFKVGDKTVLPGDTIDVYTKGDVDKKLNDLNSLTYKGTIGSQGATIPTAGVKIGDMYMVAGEAQGITVLKPDASGNTTVNAKQGDLIIAVSASGEEVDGVIADADLRWTYVPSGDDAQTDTTYSFVVDAAGNRLLIKQNGSDFSGLSFAAGDAIEVSSEVDEDTQGLKTTVKHAKVTRSDVTADAASEVTEVEAVTGVETNAQGHVTKVTTKKFGLATYALADAAAISISSGVASVTTTLNASNANDSSSIFKLGSTSLALSAEDNTLTVDLVWGTF